MKLILMALVTFAMDASVAHATCFPKNNLWIPRHTTIQTHDIAEDVFNSAIDKVLNHYGPIVKKELGCALVFNRLWDDGTVNSDTTVDASGNCVVNSYGGLARFPGMESESAYAAVACHEVGHHMGGAPIYSDQDWAAVEGEADYWATKECMKGIGYSAQESQDAALALAKVLGALGGDPVPDPSKIDKSVVKKTYEDHPKAQCRLDTYLNGLACDVLGPMSQEDPKVNSCFDYPSKKTYAVGSRPRCWFAP